MTTKPPEALNPLERISSLVDDERVSAYERLENIRAIIDASDGWVYVPVEMNLKQVMFLTRARMGGLSNGEMYAGLIAASQEKGHE